MSIMFIFIVVIFVGLIVGAVVMGVTEDKNKE